MHREPLAVGSNWLLFYRTQRSNQLLIAANQQIIYRTRQNKHLSSATKQPTIDSGKPRKLFTERGKPIN